MSQRDPHRRIPAAGRDRSDPPDVEEPEMSVRAPEAPDQPRPKRLRDDGDGEPTEDDAGSA